MLGRILHLQRLSTEDGPGIRTTVFFKGCPLHCAWCHNPESLSPHVQIQWFAGRCLHCHSCLENCPEGCLVMTPQGLQIDRERCSGCATCVDACPGGALEALGRDVTLEWLLAELLKDRAYYEKSGGGVTLSGGEPALQPDFVLAVLRGLKSAGISTALDTCGLCAPATFESFLPYTDLVLFDLKLMDSAVHHQYTGLDNQRILANLRLLADWRRRHLNPDLWIRTPLIPGATDAPENLRAIGAYLAAHLDGCVQRWELCAFNNLCADKYQRLGLEWQYARFPLMTADHLQRCEQAAQESGVDPAVVIATGATRQEIPS